MNFKFILSEIFDRSRSFELRLKGIKSGEGFKLIKEGESFTLVFPKTVSSVVVGCNCGKCETKEHTERHESGNFMLSEMPFRPAAPEDCRWERERKEDSNHFVSRSLAKAPRHLCKIKDVRCCCACHSNFDLKSQGFNPENEKHSLRLRNQGVSFIPKKPVCARCISLLVRGLMSPELLKCLG